MTNDRQKKIAVNEAVKLVQNNMKIGIGTGTTTELFIKALLSHITTKNITIKCICTSIKSKEAVGKCIPFLNESLNEEIDITFDGADLFDQNTFHRIKGGGGALLREKIVALRSKINVVIIDSCKLLSPLGNCKLPIEIIPFGYLSTIQKLNELGYIGNIRSDINGIVYSDNNNYLFDIDYNYIIENIEKEHNSIKTIPGVVETGLFFQNANIAYIGNKDGTVTELRKKSND